MAADGRTEKEKALDAVLLLYFLKTADPIWGRAKLQKTPFFVELALQREGAVATHYPYFRWKNGPFSPLLWDDLDRLREEQLVQQWPGSYQITERGNFFLDLALDELRAANADDIFAVVDEVLQWCKPRSGEQLIEAAYQIELEPAGMPGIRLKVRDIPLGVDILLPPHDGLRADDELVAVLQEQLAITPAQHEAAMKDESIVQRADARLLSAATGYRRA